MALISIANLSFSYGERQVLDGVNLTLSQGEHVGLVGRNGCGKSTLLRIISGTDSLKPDSGQVQLARGTTVGYLTQDFDLDPNLPLRDEASRAFSKLDQLHQKMQQVSHQMADAEDGQLDRLLKRYENLEQKMQAAGGYAVDHQIDGTLHGLGLTEEVFGVQVKDLSGGQKGRLALAKLLLSKTDVLLLDEPTNHLDIAGRQWLEQYLIGYRGAVIIITHDRWMLSRTVSKIHELELGQLVEYPGNYQQYRELREERHLAQQRAYEKQQTKVRQEQAFIDRYRAGQRARQAQGREKRLERFKQNELVGRPVEAGTMNINFTVANRAGDLVIGADNIKKGYEGKPLFGPLSITIKRGARVGVIGPNGAGKSTLARCMLGDCTCDQGVSRLGAQVSVGYYKQTQDDLNLSQTVLEYLQRQLPDGLEQSVHDLAGAFLFSGLDQEKLLGVLSGGERSRAVLAGLVSGGHNLLVLDEPTNHLDIPSSERLEAALLRYVEPSSGWGRNTRGGGTLIVITHDRMLLDNLVDQLLIFDGHGQVRHFYGSYSEFMSIEQDIQSVPEDAKPLNTKKTDRKSTCSGRGAKQSHKSRSGQIKSEQIEAKIIKLEQELSEIDVKLAEPEIYRDVAKMRKLLDQRKAVARQLDLLEAEWFQRGIESQ